MQTQSGQESVIGAAAERLVPDTLSPDIFKQAFRGHPAGVAIVTAEGRSGPVGLTATSVFSVSASPPLFAFSLSASSPTSEALTNADTVVAHLLSIEQMEAAKLFSTSGAERFADPSTWARLETGEPYLLNASIWIRGRIVERLKMQAGSATVVACHALEARIAPGTHDPLVYHDRIWHRIGSHSQITG